MQPNRQYPVQEMERIFSSVMAIFADMERTTLDRNYRSFAIAFVLLITASTGLWWLLPHSTLKNTRPDYFGDKVNLALRRTAHYLMAASGDSTSTIAPVEKTADNTWQIRMERNLNYDLLPSVLQESLERHNIHEDYDVEVLKCRDSTLQLGYNFFDFQREGGRRRQALTRRLNPLRAHCWPAPRPPGRTARRSAPPRQHRSTCFPPCTALKAARTATSVLP